MLGWTSSFITHFYCRVSWWQALRRHRRIWLSNWLTAALHHLQQYPPHTTTPLLWITIIHMFLYIHHYICQLSLQMLHNQWHSEAGDHSGIVQLGVSLQYVHDSDRGQTGCGSPPQQKGTGCLHSTGRSKSSFICASNDFISVECNQCCFLSWIQFEKGQTKRDACSLLGITCLLGITWGLVFFSSVDLSLIGPYLFCILNTLQGLHGQLARICWSCN